MVSSALKGGRGETLYCATVCAMKGGGGEPEQRWYLQRISLIRAHTPSSTLISCKGQPEARHATLAAYAAPVVEGAQERAFWLTRGALGLTRALCLREIILTSGYLRCISLLLAADARIQPATRGTMK